MAPATGCHVPGVIILLQSFHHLRGDDMKFHPAIVYSFQQRWSSTAIAYSEGGINYWCWATFLCILPLLCNWAFLLWVHYFRNSTIGSPCILITLIKKSKLSFWESIWLHHNHKENDMAISPTFCHSDARKNLYSYRADFAELILCWLSFFTIDVIGRLTRSLGEGRGEAKKNTSQAACGLW